MTALGWKALVVEWKDLVRHYPDGMDTGAFHRLVFRHAGTVEDTGGGIEVGFVRFGDGSTATVTDEMLALWGSGEPFVEMPSEEIFAAEVSR